MRQARTPYLSRLIAGILLASMLPALFVLPSSAASGATYGSYSRWIRAQLRVPADASFDVAISKASESRPGSLEAFIEAFLDAYERANPGKSAAQAFTDIDLSDDALITYLQRRYTQIGDEGVLPRVYFTTASSAGIAAGQADTCGDAVSESDPQLRAHSGAGTICAEAAIVVSLRTLSSAHPLGP